MDQKTLGLYLHIPFCVQKCRYCDFTSYAGKGEEFKNRYIKCLITQLRRLATAPSGGLPALSGRFVDIETNKKIVDTFLATEFEGGRHAKRLAKLLPLERTGA